MADTDPNEEPAAAPNDGADHVDIVPASEADAAGGAAGGRPMSDTIGTGSGCAIGCTMLTLAIIALGIVLFLIMR